MRGTDRKLLLCMMLAAAAGIGLHGAFDRWPSIVTEFFAPVNESLWEHVKLLFWPYLLTGLYLTGSGRWSTAPWLASLLLSCTLMLPFGWMIHKYMTANTIIGHLILYGLLIVLQYALPDLLPLGERWTGLLSAGVILLCGMIICWTIQPPNHPLFHDLSLADTFFRLPC